MRRMTTAPCGLVVVAVLALLVGFALGQSRTGGRAGATAATPEAATPGAEAAVCVTPTPTPTATPAPTPTPVPPVAAGQPLPYAGNWTVTVTGVSLLPTFTDLTATGIYARVDLAIVNGEAGPRRFPYEELVLRDAQERPYLRDLPVAARNEAGAFSPFPPSLPTPGFVIFDVAADATGPFVLESTADPTFRVLVELQRRG